MAGFVGLRTGTIALLTWLLCCTVHSTQARILALMGPEHTSSNSSSYVALNGLLQWTSDAVEGALPAPGQTFRSWRSTRAFTLERTNINWRPFFVLGAGEVLGHMVRGVTGMSQLFMLTLSGPFENGQGVLQLTFVYGMLSFNRHRECR